MRIRFHPYVLKSKGSLNRLDGGADRAGALLRVESENGIGYADLHPWPELGELSLSGQLESLRRWEPTHVAARALEIAAWDGAARAAAQSLFPMDRRLENNALLGPDVFRHAATDVVLDLRERGFRVAKLKCGRDGIAEARWFREASSAGLRWRLDFNSADVIFTQAFFEEAGDLSAVDYIEDPEPYDAATWAAWRKRVPLALDAESAGELGSTTPADALIWKPARRSRASLAQDYSALAQDRSEAHRPRVVVTSMMDHPLGVAAAMAEALIPAVDFSVEKVAGCLTLDLFEPEEFRRAFVVEDAWITPPSGTGLGFDELLARLDWSDL